MSSVAAENPSNAYALKAAAVVAPFVDANLFSGLILVAHRGKPIFHEAFGLANREWMIANSPDTRFRIGSITKQFTAAAIVMLAERGKLNVTDLVSTHYANAPESWHEATIHQLLTHTSGIPSYTGFPDFVSKIGRIDHTPEQILDLVRDLPLEFTPGERFSYCNSGYALLGLIVEKLSGQTYSAFLRSEIFDPLGMSNTGYDETRAILPRRAAGYERHGGKWINALYSAMSVPYAAGGLYSTADDLLRWTEALSNGNVISAASLDEMLRDHGHGYGYGWFIVNRSDRRLHHHGGGINGFVCALDRYLDDELTVVVLSNLQHAIIPAIAERLANLHFGRHEPRASVPIDSPLLEAYTGCYRLGPKYFVRVTIEAGALNIHARGQESLRLAYAGADSFFCQVRDMQIDFQRADEGGIVALLDRERGCDFVAHRVEEAFARQIEQAPLQSADHAGAETENFAQYAGWYRLSAYMDIEVTCEAGQIHVQATGQEKLATVYRGMRRFELVGRNIAAITFELDGDGTVCNLILHQAGVDWRGFRLNEANRPAQ
ncbi:serine hydrolase [Paraburkholderia sp. BCC1876]|uniref:serine hydrolase n=1 Tax=Paraburkholderia sp. BCC1876 TaxID=2676303 RepID=UPI00158FA9A0|nr:serine hydrolase [Paraburkholderia sp. BCC1876]